MGLRKFVQVLQRFRLQHGVSKYVAVKVSLTYILKYSLHERDRNFSLLHEVVFRVLHLQARSLLLRRIELQPANADSLARLT